MLSQTARGLFATLAAASALWAGDFWKNKGHEDWSAAEVGRILVDSPWSRETPVAFRNDGSGGIGGQVPSGGGSGVPRGGGMPGGIGLPGGGLPNGGWGGRLGFAPSSSFGEPTLIRWQSAKPVQQALRRVRNVPLNVDQAAANERRNQRYYVVLLSSLPPSAGPLIETPDIFKRAAFLKRKGREPIRVDRVEILPQPRTPAVLLMFPRDEGISLADKAVEVAVTLDELEIRRKFKLKEMIYEGRLGL